MARALAAKRDIDPVLAPAAETQPRRRRQRSADGAENARILQQRLEDAYAAPTPGAERELSPFSRLAIIVAASCSLWSVIALGVAAVV